MRARSRVADPEEASETRRRQIGELIRASRQNMSQAALGALLGDVPQTTVSRWEKGMVDLTLEQIRELEIALSLSPGTLAKGAGYMDEQSEDIYDLIMADQKIVPDLRVSAAAQYRSYVDMSSKFTRGRARAGSRR